MKNEIKLVETIINLEFQTLQNKYLLNNIIQKTKLNFSDEELRNIDEFCLEVLMNKYPNGELELIHRSKFNAPEI